jgi:hypothetical protein
MNYSQLTAAQQAAIDAYVTGLAPAVGQLSKFLEVINPVDVQYLSSASAALGLLLTSEYTFANFAATVANTAAPSVTSVSHTFTADEIGNYFNLTIGTNCTLGLYQIKNVIGGAAILDRACASIASPSSITANVLPMVPNKTNMAGSQAFLSRADVVTMASHLEVALAMRDSNHQQLWVKACGPGNL